MASPWSDLRRLLADSVDAEFIPSLYAAASVPTATIREELKAAQLPYLDTATGKVPEQAELERAARVIVGSARNRATAVGAVSGLMGAAAVPPEVVASLIQLLRLAQRLSVIYGFDPETDTGKVLLWRAIAAAYEVEIPTHVQLGLKVRDVAELVRSQVPATQDATAWVGRQLATRTALAAIGRITRLVPGLGAGMAAYGARKRVKEMGERMIVVFQKACEAVPWDLGNEVIAVEVR